MSTISWLPDIIDYSQYGGDWDAYLEEIYTKFCDDFHRTPIIFKNERVSAKKHPELAGKSATFWHIVSSGRTEEERVPDIPRCESVLWPRAIIENCSDSAVLQWETYEHSGGPRVLLWLKPHDYLVVLGKRNGYYILITAYRTSYSHTRSKLQKAYDTYISSSTTTTTTVTTTTTTSTTTTTTPSGFDT